MIGEVASRGWGLRSSVGVPVAREPAVGLHRVAFATRSGRCRPDTEARLASFTELVATAIANTEAARLARLAEEQAALRRVATLVAQGRRRRRCSRRSLRSSRGWFRSIWRAWRATSLTIRSSTLPAGAGQWAVSRWQPVDPGRKNLATAVFETGRPARVESQADRSSGSLADLVREMGVRRLIGRRSSSRAGSGA